MFNTNTIPMSLKTLLNHSINYTNINNTFSQTFGVFKECKTPKRKPDYISYTKDGKKSSSYWYGTDSKGDYIIRQSNHWSSNLTSKVLTKGCGFIRSTYWILKSFKGRTKPASNTGKIHLSNFKIINSRHKFL